MELALPVLERVVARYRRDVNHLAPAAAPEALAALESHLDRRLPSDLRRFLSLHNGAVLFRGALRLRSTSEIAIASEAAPQVVLFADAAGDVRWAWADAGGVHVYGTWDGERLDPVYGSFVAWLEGELTLVETRVTRDEDRDQLRREVAPDDPHVLARAGRQALAAGRPDEAEALLREATRRDPANHRAWQLLGDALAIRDRQAARQAWLQAFRRTRLPLPWPGAPCLQPEVLTSLGLTFAHEEEWERELLRFLNDQVGDVTDAESLAIVSAAAIQLARSLVRRGRRRAARDVLADLGSRCHAFSWKTPPWGVLLELAQIECGLGHHDEAEALLRRLRREGPPELRAQALVLLGEIAVTRQEPWAEDILEEAAAAEPDDGCRLQIALLRVERAVRQQRAQEASRAADGLAKLAKRVGVPRLEALARLAEGDVARLQGNAADARALYRQGLAGLGERDPEVRCRLLLRLADLAAAEGRAEEAEDHAEQAADGFRAIELPVREAWALLRLARAVAERAPDRAAQLRAHARERFLEADLASGVAAVDSLTGDPGASLAWHLERSTAHARARHDAQRCRPPWDRADADRPERRLGAHRLAIAACDTGVVTALAREMDAQVRAVATGHGRPTDPPVLRYVAAVDLLSGHRSYEAARVLLDHLLLKGLDGTMLRALQGAIARSPNAALVDGLLRCVERPTEYPASAVASAAELLGLRREPVAVRPLIRLLEASASPLARRAAIAALGRIGNRSVVEAILPALDDPRLAEQAALALLMLGDRRGVEFHGRALVEERADLSGSPGEIVGRYGSPEHLLLLVRAAGGEGDRALGALQGLGLLGDPRGVRALLEALGSRDRRAVEVASGALTILTGRLDDPNEPGVRTRWTEWWQAHEGSFRPGVRHRYGKPFDCGLLIDRMSDADPYVRRTAYDELVITSGEALPFDADGPWRVQQAHLREWRRWWAQARHRLPAGHWTLDGERIA